MSRQATKARHRANKPHVTPAAMAAVHQGIRIQATAELQRKANASLPVAHLNGLQSQVVQREAVMDYVTWKDSSSKTGRKRSNDLLAIDEALILYHESLEEKVSVQRHRLEDLQAAIDGWELSKKGSDSTVKSIRAGKVARLKRQVADKMAKLKKIPDAKPQYGSRSDFTHDVYSRVRARVQNILSIERPRASRDTRKQMVAHLAEMREQARDIDPNHKPVDALWDACSVLIAVAEVHLGVRVHTRNHKSARAALSVYRSRFDGSLLAARKQISKSPKAASRITTYLETAVRDLNVFSAIGGTVETDMPDMGPGDAFDEFTGVADEAMNALGMQGTGGKGNEGLEEYWKTNIDGCDPLAEAKKTVAKITGGLHQKTGDNATEQEKAQASSANDQMSGAADYGAGLVMATQLGAEIARYVNIVKYCKGKPELKARRNWAIAKIVLLTTAGTTATLSKALGGELTFARGHGYTANSNFFDNTQENKDQGIDMSTDVKLVGDSANILLSAVAAVKSIVSTVRKIKKRTATTENYKKGNKKVAEDTLDSAGDIAGTVSAAANTYSALTKVYFQIAGGGQIASESASAIAKGTTGPISIVPLLGVVKGVLDLVRKGIDVGKAVKSRKKVTKARDKFAKEGSEGLLAALRVTKETYNKRMKRAIIDIIHSAGSITGGILATTGFGTAISGLIGIASGVAKLFQIGARTAKQKLRNKKGGKLTNLEKQAEAELDPHQEFVSQHLKNVRKRLKGKSARGFNADKTTVNKEARYRNAALEILRAPPDQQKVFIKTMRLRRGMTEIENKFKKDGNQQKRVARQINLIVSAFKER